MDTLKEKNILEELWSSGNAPWKLSEQEPQIRRELRAL
jgi:hypothetical protein